MGLASLPTPSEGVLTVVLVNTALSVSILKQLIRSALGILGFQSYLMEMDQSSSDDALQGGADCSEGPTLTDRFRSRFRPVRFGRKCCDQTRNGGVDCRVCLCRFEQDSVVARLPCGHLFHRSCVEKWLDYHHATCPLCRTRVLPEEPEPVGSGPVWF